MQRKKVDNQDYSITQKVVLFGDSQSGKSSLVTCIKDDRPTRSSVPTVGIDFKVVTINQVRLQIWDSSGQERFFTSKISHLYGAHCVIIVYDVTNTESFENIPHWVKKSESIANNPPIFLIGTKTDLISDRRITSEEGEEFANSGKIPNCIGWAEVSSAENFNVAQTFQRLISIIIEDNIDFYPELKMQENEKKPLDRYSLLNENQKKYITQLQTVWDEGRKKLRNEQNNMSEDNIQLTLIKSVLDYYSKNDNILSLLFSPSSWASHHISTVNLISNSIITSNPTPREIIERLERLNPIATGDVASIIHFLKEKINFYSDNEEKKVLKSIKYG